MTQLITPASSSATVEGYVRGFMFTDADGSTRVDQAGLVAWLAGQFAYLTNFGTPATDKTAQGAYIASRLAAIVDRENWTSNPAYPAAGNTSETATTRLAQIMTSMVQEVRAMEAPYHDFQSGLSARAKVIFNDIVAPGFNNGSDPIESTRLYVETFITDRGEESRPSPPSALQTMDENDEAHVTCNSAPSGRNIVSRRLYRSATGTGSSAFRLQGEYPIATSTIVDTKPDAQLAEVCPTFGWLEPPATLAGLAAMPNGIMLGYVGRTLHACEPYAPYAWPAKYDKPLAHPITGTVAVGQSLFVGTTDRPYLVSGSDSASLSEELISSKVPCVSALSMVAIANSVFYAAPDGLALYENGSVNIVTDAVFDRKTWQSYNPASMRAAEHNGMYKVFYTKADSSKGCLVFDYKNKTISELDQAADAVFANASGIYILNGTAVYDLEPASGSNRTGYWYSKVFRLVRPQAFGWIMVDGGEEGFTGSAIIRVYADGALHHTATITSAAPVRNKPGRHSNWHIEVESAAKIAGVVLATTTDELKAVI